MRVYPFKLGISAALLTLTVGCTNPSDVGVETLPEDSVEAITGDGWFDTFQDAAPETEDDTPCVPDCIAPGGGKKECGDDGCGGETCGTCFDDLLCVDYACVPDCEFVCDGLECGDGGTEGFCDCGACGVGYGCSDEGACSAECGTLCQGLECGPAGDQGECDCGACEENYVCAEGICEVDCDAACAVVDCTPEWAVGLCDCGICDDSNACTDDVCLVDGSCEYPGLDDIECDDGDLCTEGDVCEAGTCVASPVDCDDDNLCTDDSCDGETGDCVSTPNTLDCDDEDVCTVADECEDGVCAGVAVGCECVIDEDCAELEDEDLCNGTLYCDTTVVPHLCEVDPDTVVICPDPDADDPDAPCLQASCDSKSAECGFAADNDGFPCEDGDACTVADYCEEGACLGGVDANCIDGNPCTDDGCDPLTGCTQVPNDDSCENGNPCTVGDQCQDGECVGGPPPVCNDGNLCTDDTCDPEVIGGCLFKWNILDCDDGSACTLVDACFLGECVGNVAPDCEDFNPCTDDSCDPQSGCVYTDNTLDCDDGDPCTVNDLCAAGICSGSGALDCDDGNPCTTGLCQAGAGCVQQPAMGACEDDNACTFGETCIGGLCTPQGNLECDDGDLCTTDSCDPATGCVFEPNSLPCDDGDACTLDDTCQEGACQGSVDVICQDANPCTADLCDPQTGCQFVLLEGPCENGNPCTEDDACMDGFCVSGGVKNCDDGNPCTTDSCDPLSGCVNAPNSAPCNDDEACTFPDACADGQCAGEPVVCGDGSPCIDGICEVPACDATDPEACDDDNPCTDDGCAEGLCENGPLEDGECSDGNACTTGDHCDEDGDCASTGLDECDDDNPCTDDWCEPLSGCEHTPNDLPCSDGDACTTADLCQDGECVPTGPSLDCDDGNPCTDDSCDPDMGCVNTPNQAPCDDGNECTTGDACANGACSAAGDLACDDQNSCTLDTCDPLSGCVNTVQDGPCSDGDACTVGDFCVDGSCAPGAALVCEDDNPCTDDSCVSGQCVFTPNEAECSDGNACTLGDHCAGGQCEHLSLQLCDDDNPCTLDSCDPSAGCVWQPIDGACSDGDACTGNDQCVYGLCVSGEPIDCDDGNPCTDDSCDFALQDCAHTPNEAPCDDLSECTSNDVCADGECHGEGSDECDDENPCTKDICLAEGGCDYELLSDLPCSDGDACTTSDLCVEGECVGGEMVVCDDGNPCTDDVCEPAAGCVFMPNEDPCTDGNACTDGDGCEGTECVPGGALDCDDDNSCTQDSCAPEEGCVYVFVDNPCSDNNECTITDQCLGGVCVGSGNLTCNDGNPCTDDWCDVLEGCINWANDMDCTDGSVCTVGDVCTDGACAPGPALPCDDENVCTEDSCDAQNGCVYVATAGPCTDDDECTTGDTCVDGQCEVDGELDCDDDNPCTDDSCDPVIGCVNAPNDLLCTDSNACTTGDHCVDGACVIAGPTECGDDNICTTDSCDPTEGCLNTPNDEPCDDGSECTTGDTCSGGACVPGQALFCDDNNGCTDDTCDPMTGCVFTPNDDPCDDQNECTTSDFCVNGDCVGEGSKECDDGLECTKDICLPDGGCAVELLTDTPCSDGIPCTIGDICQDGLCIAGEPLACDDGNVCTDDACVEGQCEFTANSEGCTDDNECTTGDHCADKQCVTDGTLPCDDDNVCTTDSCDPVGGCANTANDLLCDDLNECTTGDHCVDKQCQPTGILGCDDDNPCTDDSCSEVDGCVNTPNDANTCTDNDLCTDGDSCLGGVCVLGPALDCEDYNVCSTDSCDPVGGCVHVATDIPPCTDEDACTTGDHCVDMQCVSTGTLNCDDGNTCTDDTCHDIYGCLYAPNTNDCTDNDDCTDGDKCQGKTCIPGPTLDCDDEIACTVDSCQSSGGCVNLPLDGLCNDSNDCTVDSCDAEQGCQTINQPVDCVLSDWGPWSECSAVCGGGTRTRSKEILTPASCSGAPCGPTQELESCNTDPCPIDCEWHWGEWSDCSGACPQGTRSRTIVIDVEAMYGGQACPTGDDATESESCSTVGNPCDDTDPCTLNDTCTAGGCVGTPATQISVTEGGCVDTNGCTLDECIPGQGSMTCTHTNQPVDCQMSEWSSWTSCEPTVPGTCAGSQSRTREVLVQPECGGAACPPGEETQTCSMIQGAACEDGIFCTSFEACDGGGNCTGAVPVNTVCADTDPCSADVCDPDDDLADEDGCTHTNVPVPCVLGPWSDWSECSAECGGGTQTRTREILVNPDCGAAACDPTEETQDCNTQSCCVPATCIDLEAECGQQSDGCGGTLECGGCDDEIDCTLDACTQKVGPQLGFKDLTPVLSKTGGCNSSTAWTTRIEVTETTTVTSLGLTTTSGLQVTAVLMAGLDNYTPGQALACSAAVPVAVGDVDFPIGPITLDPGFYWIAFIGDYLEVQLGDDSTGIAYQVYFPSSEACSTLCDASLFTDLNPYQNKSILAWMDTSLDGFECTHTDVPEDCEGDWGDWSDCEGTEGACAGTRTRTFTPTQQPACGGVACPTTETEDCPFAEDVSCGGQVGGLCNEGALCDGTGICVGGTPNPALCDDQDDCTVDACAETIGDPSGFPDLVTIDTMSIGCSLNLAWATRLEVGAAITVTSVFAEIESATDIKAILYSDGGTEPGALLGCSALIPTVAGTAEFQFASIALDPGYYWIGFHAAAAEVGYGGDTSTDSAVLIYSGQAACDAACSGTPYGETILSENLAAKVWIPGQLDGGYECTNTHAPVDCEGDWTEWTDCTPGENECSGTRTQTFIPTQQSACGGVECPDPIVQDCDMPSGSSCTSDGVGCTDNEECTGSGACVGTPNDAPCDDADSCTTDSCGGGTFTYGTKDEGMAFDWAYQVGTPTNGENCIFANIMLGRFTIAEEATVDTLGTWLVHYAPANEAAGLRLNLYSGASTPSLFVACTTAFPSTGHTGMVEATLDQPVVLPPGTYWMTALTAGEVEIGYTSSGELLFLPSAAVPCGCTDGGLSGLIDEAPNAQFIFWAEDTSGCTYTDVTPVDCVGAWGAWSDCVQEGDTCDGDRSRTFSITTVATCGGTECPFANNAIEFEPCTMPAQTSCDDDAPCTALDGCDEEGDCAGIDAVTVAVGLGGCDDGDDCSTDACMVNFGEQVCSHLDICSGAPVINEVDYDQDDTSSDTMEFVEIYNPSESGVDLSEYKLELVNGATDDLYGSLGLDWNLDTNMLGAGEMLVFGSDALLATVPPATLQISLGTTNVLQNGAPDGVRIVTVAGSVFVDGVAYEGTMAGTGEGTSAPTDTGSGDGSIGRCPDGTDTNDNAVDFELLGTPTPGTANTCN